MPQIEQQIGFIFPANGEAEVSENILQKLGRRKTAIKEIPG